MIPLQNLESSGAFDERAFEHAGGADTPMPSSIQTSGERITPSMIEEGLRMKGVAAVYE